MPSARALDLTIRVKPGSSRVRVGGSYADPPQLVVSVNAPPVDGRANEAVCAAVAAALGLRPRQVTLVSGQTARTKVLRLTDVDVATLRPLIESLLAN